MLENINGGKEITNPGDAWKAIGKLKQGKSITTKLTPMSLRKENGELCTSPEENTQVMANYLDSGFHQTGEFEASAIDLVRQRDPTPWLWMK